MNWNEKQTRQNAAKRPSLAFTAKYAVVFSVGGFALKETIEQNYLTQESTVGEASGVIKCTAFFNWKNTPPYCANCDTH